MLIGSGKFPLNGVKQDRRIDGLDQTLAGIELMGHADEDGMWTTGDDDDLDGRMVAPEGFKGIDSMHRWIQGEIEKGKIDGFSGTGFDCGGAIGNTDRTKSLIGQKIPQRLPNQGIVIDDQDAIRRLGEGYHGEYLVDRLSWRASCHPLSGLSYRQNPVTIKHPKAMPSTRIAATAQTIAPAPSCFSSIRQIGSKSVFFMCPIYPDT